MGVYLDQYREQHADNRSTGRQILVALSLEGADTRSWKRVWSHRIHDDGSWNSEFKDHLKKYGIKPILARVKHPQTNGSWNGFSENTSSTGLLFIHSTSLSLGITIDIDLMEA